jgi:hypothetical protein
MSQVGDALTGSSGSGTSNTTMSDLSLGDALTGGTGDPFGDAAATSGDVTASDAGGGGFQNFNNLTAALGGAGGGAGASPVAAQSASMTPPSSAAQTGGDPTGAAGGTQSSTSPGQTPSNQQSGGTQQNQQQNQDPNYAPPSAVNQLKALLKQLNTGKVPGPTGPTPQGGQNAPFALPTLAAGQTGARSPQMALPALAAGQTGEQSPQMALPEVATGETGPQSPGPAALRQRLAGQPATDAQGQPVTAAGTPAADTPLPPSRPANLGQTAQTAQTAPAGQGRDITVQKAGAGAQPQPTQALPTKPPKQLPTHKPGPPEAQPQGPPPAQQPPTDTHSNIPPSRLIQDIAGISTGQPSALADLARAAGMILPLFMGGRRGRFGGGFRGGRFTRGIGGFGHLHGGRHPAGPGAWPYHHPQFGWHMHAFHPGGGWRPLHPNDGQAIVGGGGQGGQDPNAPPQQTGGPDPDAPPKETGAAVGTPDSVGSSGAIPNVGAKEVDDYTRKVAQQYNIDPDVASRVLAQESSYGQARKPGDNGTSFGPFQLHFAPDGKAMGDQFMRDTGLDPRDPRTWKQQIDYAMMKAAQGGWAPWTTTMHKLGMNEWSGINRRFAGQPYSRDPAGMSGAASIPVGKLPPRSQPSVAG